MAESVELYELDLRYEAHRLRDDAWEARLMSSIARFGIEEPLQGVDTPEGRMLLNGFKRYRCAEKLKIFCVPYQSLGEDEAAGIIHLLRGSTRRGLTILEQARFIDDLLAVHGLRLAEVAETLGRSKSWVSMRRRLLEEMSQEVRRILFRGTFPVYSYLYTLRPFMRMNAERREQVERFLRAVAGEGPSVRDIDLLAQGYFHGPASLREAIDSGKLNWTLEQMKHVPEDHEGCSPLEQRLLKDLRMLNQYVRRVMAKCQNRRLGSRAFHAQANLLAGGLLSQLPVFHEIIKAFHDRSGHA